MASALHWIPDTLYNCSILVVASSYHAYKNILTTLVNERMLFDIFYQLYKQSHLKELSLEFSNLDTFKRLLRVSDKSILLHNCFQALMDDGHPIAGNLATAYQDACKNVIDSNKMNVIQLGFNLGDFLVDAGWYLESEKIFSNCLALCETVSSEHAWRLDLQCYTRLLRVRNCYSKFKEARSTLLKAQSFIQNIKNLRLPANFASLYSEFSSFYYFTCDYKECYRWSIEALKQLNASLHPKEIIRILCQASKAAILKRQHKRSEIIIKQALYLARENFGPHDIVYAYVLVIYGYHLTNIDFVENGVKAYQTALNILSNVFGGNNLHVAQCHEDFAYALYLSTVDMYPEYSIGRFKDSLEHADKSLSILQNLNVQNKFLSICAKRIKALIFEEKAFDCFDFEEQDRIFANALELHQYGFKCVLEEFGETSLLLARYHSNLARLYQSMKKCQEAQEHYSKAIAIREHLLNKDDYELALSYEQMASLYTYNMDLYPEAEVLYLKSIEIYKKLFGDGYRHLEFLYKALIKIYIMINNSEKAYVFHSMYHKWKELRDETAVVQRNYSLQTDDIFPIAPESILSHLPDF